MVLIKLNAVLSTLRVITVEETMAIKAEQRSPLEE